MRVKMKLKKMIAAGLLSCAAFTAFHMPSASAEYLTAYEDIKYEKYIVDTASFYYPDEKNKLGQYNCIVWYYTSKEDKGTPYTFRFKYENNQWNVAERDSKGNLMWAKVDNNSVASDVLRVSLPYLGKTTNKVDRSGATPK